MDENQTAITLPAEEVDTLVVLYGLLCNAEGRSVTEHLGSLPDRQQRE